MNTLQVGRALGWFSLGLGLAQLIAPRKLGPAIGVNENYALLKGLGAREITSGLGILTSNKPAPWLWSRVAGDLMDLALLGVAYSTNRDARSRILAATAAVAGVTALDVYCGAQLSKAEHPSNGRAPKGKLVRKSVTINKPAGELYAFWRNFENLPKFMNHLKSVTVSGEQRSHWVAKGPLNTSVEWDAEITEERANEMISWRSLPGSDVDTQGTVRFEPAAGGRGTVVRIELTYNPPMGRVGATMAKLFGEAPEKQIPLDLLRFRSLMETGEIARTEGQTAGRAKSTSRKFDDMIRA